METQNRQKKQIVWGVVVVTLILAIISGALAGVIATIITNQSLNQYAESLSDRERLFTISETKPRPLPGTYEEALSTVQESGWPALAHVRPISKDSLEVEDWITRNDSLGYGSVITSDGWLLFHESTFSSFNDPVAQSEVWIQSERFNVEEIISDTLSDFVMIKIDAQSLPTLAFGPSDGMLGGDIVFATLNTQEIIPSSLQGAEIRSEVLVQEAEQYTTKWKLGDKLSSPSPLLNPSGELVGFSEGEDSAVPLHHLRPFIQSVLRYNEVRYAGIGVYTVSISDVLNIDSSVKEKTKFGALVISPERRVRAVRPDSPAENAGIEAGDIIISVDDVLITQTFTLAELLKGYEPDATALFRIIRGEEELDVEVTFKNVKDLVY